MTSKWDSELTEEKLQDQIKAAREKWRGIKIKVKEVYYKPDDKCLYFVIVDDQYTEELYYFDKYNFKCLEGISDEDLAKVSMLGDRGIQWKNLDIQLSIDKLLEGIQLISDWVDDLGK